MTNRIEKDGSEPKSEFGTSAVIGCPLLPVKLELRRRGLPVLSPC